MDALLEASWTWQQRDGHSVFTAPNVNPDIDPHATVFGSSAASSEYARDG